MQDEATQLESQSLNIQEIPNLLGSNPVSRFKLDSTKRADVVEAKVVKSWGGNG